VIQDAARRLDDPDVRRVYARRLWQAGRHAELSELPAGPGAHTEVLVFRALARGTAADDVGAAETGGLGALRATLAERRGDMYARAWLAALGPGAREGADGAAPGTDPRVRAAQEALKENPHEPVFQVMLGDALAALDRSEEARAAWQQAALSPLARGWAVPALRISESLLREGRVPEAMASAQRALDIAPTSVAANVSYITAQVAMLEAGYPLEDSPRVMLERLEAAAAPLRDAPDSAAARALREAFLPGRVILLAKSGRTDEARQAVAAALAEAGSASPEVLRRLAVISSQHGLGLEEAALEAAAARGADTGGPSLALTRALLLSAQGRSAEGLALLKEGEQGAPAARRTEWRLAVAGYLERTGDAGALEAWKALVEANPDDLSVQVAALKADSVARDLPLTEKLAQRVAKLSGTEGGKPTVAARLARARALLGSTPGVRARDEAVALLKSVVAEAPGLVEARDLLVSGLLLDDPGRGVRPDVGAAIEQLRAAATVSPDKTAIALEIGRLLRRQGDFEAAAAELARVAGDAAAAPALRLRAAELLMDQGDFGQAVAPLERLAREGGEESGAHVRLRLAEAYTAVRRDADAGRVYQTLALTPPNDPEQAWAVADALAARGDAEAAGRVMAHLRGLALPRAQLTLYEARFAERHDKPAARGLYERAVEQAPEDPEAWAALARHLLAAGERTAADDAVRRGLERAPSSAALLVLREQARVAGGDLASMDLAGLAEALEKNPATRARAPIVRAVDEARRGGRLNDPAAVTELSARFPEEPAVQAMAITLLMEMKPPALGEAAQVARQARRQFPASEDLARLAVPVFQRAGDQAAALSAAEAWQQLTRDPAADLAVAEAHLGLGRPRQAIEQLTPRLEAARAHPAAEGSLGVLALVTRALVASNQERQALELIRPAAAAAPEVLVRVLIATAADEVRTAGEAARWLEEAGRHIAPAGPDQRLALAAAWLKLAERFGDAETHVPKALAVLAPLTGAGAGAPAAALELVGVAEHLRGDLPAAEAAYRGALEREPQRASAQWRLAGLLLARGSEPGEAAALAGRAVEAGAADRAALTVLARARLALADGQTGATAAATLRSAADLLATLHEGDPADLPVALALAGTRERLGEYGPAADAYERILATPAMIAKLDRAAIQNNLAYALAKSGRGGPALERARSLALAAVAAKPEAHLYDTLGAVEAARGDLAAAAEAYRRALALSPDTPSCLVELANLLATGDPPKAEEARALLARLDELGTRDPRGVEPYLERAREVRAALAQRGS